MMFKDFEIRQSTVLGGVNIPGRYELIKWYDHEPIEVTSMRTGDKKTSTRSCFVVAWLTWDTNEHGWDMESVGLRLVEHWSNGLDQFILKWCEMAAVCMEEDEE